MKKKFLVAMMAGALTISVTTTTFAAFKDVPENHWAYDSVSTVEKYGLMSGYGDGTFQGNKNMTRFEFALLIATMQDKISPMSVSKANSFSDVPESHWAANKINELAAAGILKAGGNFDGNSNINRYGMAEMIYNLLAKNGKAPKTSASKLTDVPKQYVKAVNSLVAGNIMEGYGDGTFKGNNTPNRFEIALILSNVCNILYK